MKRLAVIAVTVLSVIVAGCSSSSSPASGPKTAGQGSTTSSAPPAGPGSTSPGGTSTTLTTQQALSAAITQALVAENVAEKTYQGVIGTLGSVNPFANVVASEQQHVATLEQLASSHSVSIPPGPFNASAAPATKAVACQLGVTTENGIISLYAQLLPQVAGYADVTNVFTTLQAAARDDHLPAFQHCS